MTSATFYSAHYCEFSQKKKDFLKTVTNFETVEKAALPDYGYIAPNSALIEQEFKDLFNALQQKNLEKANKEKFWLYCYYCCLLLEKYYEAYEKKEKIKEYKDLKQKLRTHWGAPASQPQNKYFFSNLRDSIATDLKELLIETRVSKYRRMIGIANLWRIYWFFYRTTMKNAVFLAQDVHLLEKLGNLLGQNIDAKKTFSVLETPNSLLRFCSVAFFVVRFIMNSGVILKHTFYPSDEEKDLKMSARFSRELYLRQSDLINEIWGAVNTATNYNQLCHISAAAAGWVVVGFLFFDVCLILWRRHLAKQDYLIKKAQYASEYAFFENELQKNDLSVDERKFLEAQCSMSIAQTEHLNFTWKAKDSTFLFNATAAFLIMTGFSASMVLTPAIFVLGAYMVSTLGVAMYFCDGAYHNYKEKSLLLEKAQEEEQVTKALLVNYQEARNNFIFKMAKTIIIPGVLISACLISWPLAVALTLTYALYELNEAFKPSAKVIEPVLELAPVLSF